MCDVVGIIEQGQMLAVGSVAEIQRRGRAQRHRWIRVRVLGSADGLGQWLGTQGAIHDLKTDGDVTTFAHEGDDQREADLLRDMISAGFRVAAFGSHEHSLEDVFMQVTTGSVQ
jgi:ABC-2 type transport system ATP-binding protein